MKHSAGGSLCRGHNLDLLTVGLDIVESQFGARLSDRLDSSTKCDLLGDILDSISRSDLSLLAILLDKLGDTMRDVEFVWVRVRVLGLSERFDRLVPVFVECLEVSIHVVVVVAVMQVRGETYSGI